MNKKALLLGEIKGQKNQGGQTESIYKMGLTDKRL